MAAARPPEETISATTERAAVSLREKFTATVYPWADRSFAVAAPIPRLAPVTSATGIQSGRHVDLGRGRAAQAGVLFLHFDYFVSFESHESDLAGGLTVDPVFQIVAIFGFAIFTEGVAQSKFHLVVVHPFERAFIADRLLNLWRQRFGVKSGSGLRIEVH